MDGGTALKGGWFSGMRKLRISSAFGGHVPLIAPVTGSNEEMRS